MSGRDIGASVRQRLLNKSREQARPFQELLQYHAIERFLYRLAISGVSDRFLLKGSLKRRRNTGSGAVIRLGPTLDIWQSGVDRIPVTM